MQCLEQARLALSVCCGGSNPLLPSTVVTAEWWQVLLAHMRAQLLMSGWSPLSCHTVCTVCSVQATCPMGAGQSAECAKEQWECCEVFLATHAACTWKLSVHVRSLVASRKAATGSSHWCDCGVAVACVVDLVSTYTQRTVCWVESCSAFVCK